MNKQMTWAKVAMNTKTKTKTKTEPSVKIEPVSARVAMKSGAQERQRLLHEIEDTIKRVAGEKAESVKNASLVLYKITNPKKAIELATEEYFKTYNLFYEKMSQKFKPYGVNVNLSDIVNFQLDQPQENNEEKVNDNRKYAILKEIEQEIDTTINEANERTEKYQKLREIAQKFADSLTKNVNIRKNTEIVYDCNGKTLGTIGDRTIYPNKFLDPTYVDTDRRLQTASHKLFKHEFLSVLNSNGFHVRFYKDPEDPMIFTIRFFKRRIYYDSGELSD